MVTAASTPSAGPCGDWATAADVYECGPCAAIEDDADLVATNITVASELLFKLTGMQFPGQCTTTIRPACTVDLSRYSDAWWRGWGYPYMPELVAGRWYNIAAGGQLSRCQAYECGQSFGRLDTFMFPVTEATAKIDGADFSAFRIDEWRYLTRTDGHPWPTVQDLTKADTEAGTWSVTLTHGQAPPTACVQAAAQLACELTRHCKGDSKCSLPLKVTAINRQGVTYNLANVMDVIDRGATGLYFVDLVIRTYNPERLARRPRVASPDRRPHPRVGS